MKMYYVVHRTISSGILTYSSYKSEEEYFESRKGFMKDGSNLPLTDVYEFVMGSEDELSVKDFLYGNREQQKPYLMLVALKNLVKMQEDMMDSPLPDFVIHSELSKAMI
jgi:hypothetical protein